MCLGALRKLLASIKTYQKGYATAVVYQKSPVTIYIREIWDIAPWKKTIEKFSIQALQKKPQNGLFLVPDQPQIHKNNKPQINQHPPYILSQLLWLVYPLGVSHIGH